MPAPQSGHIHWGNTFRCIVCIYNTMFNVMFNVTMHSIKEYIHQIRTFFSDKEEKVEPVFINVMLSVLEIHQKLKTHPDHPPAPSKAL